MDKLLAALNGILPTGAKPAYATYVLSQREFRKILAEGLPPPEPRSEEEQLTAYEYRDFAESIHTITKLAKDSGTELVCEVHPLPVSIASDPEQPVAVIRLVEVPE